MKFSLQEGDEIKITKQNGMVTIEVPDDTQQPAPVTDPPADGTTTTDPVTVPPTDPVTVPPVDPAPSTYNLIDDLLERLKNPVKLGMVYPSGANEYGIVEDGQVHLISDNKGQAVYRRATNYEDLPATFGSEGKIVGPYRYPGVVSYGGYYYGTGWGRDGKVVVKKGRYPDTSFLSAVQNMLTGGGFTKYDQDIQPYPGGFVCTFKGDFESGGNVSKHAYIMTAPAPTGPWTKPVKIFPVKNPLIGAEETDPHFLYFRGKGYAFIGSGLLASTPQKQVLAGAEIDMQSWQAKTAPVILRIPSLDWETRDAANNLREAIFNPTGLLTQDALYFSYTQNAEIPPGSDQSKPSNMGYVKIPLKTAEYARTAVSRTPVDFNFSFAGAIQDQNKNAEAFTVMLGGNDEGAPTYKDNGLDLSAQNQYLQIDRHIDAGDIDLTIDAVLNYAKTDNPLVNIMTQNKQEEAIGHKNSIFLQFMGSSGAGTIEFATNSTYVQWPANFQINGPCKLRFVYAGGKVECWLNDKSLGQKPTMGRFQVSCVGCELPAGKNAVPKMILKALKIKITDNNGY